MKSSLFFIGFLTIAFCAYSFCQTQNKDSIEFGNTVLRLGTPKVDVLAALEKYYSVDENNGIVTTKAGPPYESVGTLIFKNGKLSEVWKQWSPDNQREGYETANNLYGVFNDLQSEGRIHCTLRTGSKQTNGGEVKSVFLLCDGKEVQIDAIQWHRDNQPDRAVIITEKLRGN